MIVKYLVFFLLITLSNTCFALEDENDPSIRKKVKVSHPPLDFLNLQETVACAVKQASSSNLSLTFQTLMSLDVREELWTSYCSSHKEFMPPLWKLSEEDSLWNLNLTSSIFLIGGIGIPHLKLLSLNMRGFLDLPLAEWDKTYEKWRRVLQKKIEQHACLRSNGAIYTMLAAALCGHPIGKALFLEALYYMKCYSPSSEFSPASSQEEDGWLAAQHTDVSMILKKNRSAIKVFCANSIGMPNEDDFPPFNLSEKENLEPLYLKMSSFGISQYDILLGRLYQENKDELEKAIFHFLKAFNSNNPDGGFALWAFYEFTGEVSQSQLYAYLKASARQGNPYALKTLQTITDKEKNKILSAQPSYHFLKNYFERKSS